MCGDQAGQARGADGASYTSSESVQPTAYRIVRGGPEKLYEVTVWSFRLVDVRGAAAAAR